MRCAGLRDKSDLITPNRPDHERIRAPGAARLRLVDCIAVRRRAGRQTLSQSLPTNIARTRRWSRLERVARVWCSPASADTADTGLARPGCWRETRRSIGREAVQLRAEKEHMCALILSAL